MFVDLFNVLCIEGSPLLMSEAKGAWPSPIPSDVEARRDERPSGVDNVLHRVRHGMIEGLARTTPLGHDEPQLYFVTADIFRRVLQYPLNVD